MTLKQADKLMTRVIYTVTVDYSQDPDESTEGYEVRDDTAEDMIKAVHYACPGYKASVLKVGVHVETKEG